MKREVGLGMDHRKAVIVDKLTDRQIAARVRQHFLERSQKSSRIINLPRSLSVTL